jgi:hypothetical protein
VRLTNTKQESFPVLDRFDLIAPAGRVISPLEPPHVRPVVQLVARVVAL